VIAIVGQGCLVVLGLAMLAALYRIFVGPTVADRVAATDLLTTCIMAVILVNSVLTGTRDYIDLVMAMAVLGFFGTVAFAKYLVGGRAID
jgi:multicomponent Na+:H+ antiporter subunit F